MFEWFKTLLRGDSNLQTESEDDRRKRQDSSDDLSTPVVTSSCASSSAANVSVDCGSDGGAGCD